MNNNLSRGKYLFCGVDDLLDYTEVGLNEVLSNKRPAILAVGVGLHENCNYNCVYCYVGTNSGRNASEWLTISEYESVCLQAVKLGCRSMILTGAQGRAEPLMTVGLPHLLKFISSNGVRPIVFTNLSVLGDALLCRHIHKIEPNDLVQLIDETGTSLIVKCDTLDGAHYDQVTTVRGSYIKFRAAVDLLANRRMTQRLSDGTIATRVSISSVISRSNFEELEQLAEYAHERQWLFICKFPSMMGSALKNNGLFFNAQEAAVRRDYTMSISDKTESLVVHDSTGDYCLIHQLGISFNNVGQPLGCLSGSLADLGPGDWTLRHKPLADIVQRKKDLYSARPGECPKKGRFYTFKGYSGDEKLDSIGQK